MLERRDFLKIVVVSSSLLLIGGLFRKILLDDKKPTPIPKQGTPPPPNFNNQSGDMLGGEVVQIQGKRLRIRNVKGEQEVVLSDDILIDEGAWTSSLPILPGDQVFMVGHPSSEGWIADKIWINAVNITGKIEQIRSTESEVQFNLQITGRPWQGKTTVSCWLPRRFLVKQEKAALLLTLWQGKSFLLKPGLHVRVVGRMYRGRVAVINMFKE